MSKLIAFRIPDDLLAKLEARGKNKSKTILRILGGEEYPLLPIVEISESGDSYKDSNVGSTGTLHGISDNAPVPPTTWPTYGGIKRAGCSECASLSGHQKGCKKGAR